MEKAGKLGGGQAVWDGKTGTDRGSQRRKRQRLLAEERLETVSENQENLE
jgi:hypothetical protein